MKLCFVASRGGHLAESKFIDEGLITSHDSFFISYEGIPVGGTDRVYYISNFQAKPLSIFKAAWQVYKIIRTERPDAIISTGAEIALPAMYLNRFLFRLPSVYVECSAQVTTPSLTGRLVYPVVDVFFVQWEGLLRHYGPKARYEGGFI